jgi:N-acyl homoserine lactone hydrolase
MRLHALHCGGDTEDRAVYDPFDSRVGEKVYSPYFLYVIEHPAGNVMFDNGCHPTLAEDPRGRLGAMAETLEIHLSREDNAEGMLRSIGMKPSDIEIVVQSHLHFDHAGGLEALPHAEVYVQQSELDFARHPPVYQQGAYVKADFDLPVKWKELHGEGEVDLFDDGSLVIFPTPGHTPGHQSLIVRLKSETVILLSDATYSIEKLRERALPALLWNPDAMVASWDLIEEIESREQARLICTHDLGFKEDVKLAPDAVYE